MNSVKIVATIGPATNNSDVLSAMDQAGMDVARLNGSHGDLEWHTHAIGLLRDTLPDTPILFDLPGRKIRTQKLEKPLSFAAHDSVVFTTDVRDGGFPRIAIDHPTLHSALQAGDTLLIDDGNLRFTVLEITGRRLTCRAENAGVLEDAKGVATPRVNVREEFLSERNLDLVRFAIESGVDFIGLSFVETAAEIKAVREMVGRKGPRLVSKIETQGALDNLADILELSDALMIDRGDLSAEVDLASIALLQKRIVSEARRVARPVIIATEFLQSMVHSPVPTKAEVSDISHGVLDHATALMLSDETARGEFPVEAVKTMRRVADVASEHLQASLDLENQLETDQVPQVMGEAIALICRRLSVTKIVAVTISGFAARMVSAKMPRQPILAVTNDVKAARQFNLLPGTKGIHIDLPFPRTSMEHIPACLEHLWRRGELSEEDLILVTTVGYPKSGNRMNFIETHKVSDLKETLKWSD